MTLSGLTFGALAFRVTDAGMRLSPMIALASLGLAACTVVPAVPTKPLAGQAPQQEDRDARECVEAAKPKTAPSYEACMISRRYMVAHHVIGSRGGKEIDLTMQTSATQPKTPAEVAADVDACRSQLRGRGTEAEGVVPLPYIGLVGVAEPNRVFKLAKYYTECMELRGYKTTLWESKR